MEQPQMTNQVLEFQSVTSLRPTEFVSFQLILLDHIT